MLVRASGIITGRMRFQADKQQVLRWEVQSLSTQSRALSNLKSLEATSNRAGHTLQSTTCSCLLPHHEIPLLQGELGWYIWSVGKLVCCEERKG